MFIVNFQLLFVLFDMKEVQEERSLLIDFLLEPKEEQQEEQQDEDDDEE